MAMLFVVSLFLGGGEGRGTIDLTEKTCFNNSFQSKRFAVPF